MSFKIIGVQPLSGCGDTVLKNLSKDLFYSFDNNYSFNSKANRVIKNEVEAVPPNFFLDRSRRQSTLESINIQAVVGKNGKGKSSIVELIIRILNNFYKQYKIGEVTDSLYFAENVHARLYFEINGKISQIYIDSRNVKIRKDKPSIIAKFYQEDKLLFNSIGKTTDTYRDELIDLEDLFFTMYINYSIYGLDDGDYCDESKYIEKIDIAESPTKKESWLTQIFHKNDGYQTPIVLHPFREAGQVYIRNEKYLVSQRLLSLILDEINNEFHITDDLIADKVQLTFKDKDPLEEYLDKVIDLHNLERNDYHTIENQFATTSRRSDNKWSVDVITQYYDFLQENVILLDRFKQVIKRKKIKLFAPKKNETYSDVASAVVLYFAKNLIKDFNPGSVTFAMAYEKLINQVEDLGIKEKIKYIISEIGNFNFYAYNLFQTLTIYFNFWKTYFGITSNEMFSSKKFSFENSLFYYCVIKSYKSISYPKYRDYNRYDTIVYFSANLHLNPKITTIAHKEFLDKISKGDNSHISLKLRQSKRMLELALKDPKAKLVNLYRKFVDQGGMVDIKELNDSINEVIQKQKLRERILYLPPRVFETDIFLKSVSSGDADININKLSSGEYQKNSIISSIVYHLKNIDSVTSEATSKMRAIKAINIKPTYNFKNINVILDEIELYFHPEYQRLFINDLIKVLSTIKFKMIKSVNFLFVTHSPFILSDIPQQNILFLNDSARPEILNNSYNTFGANIHDLLAHNFFLRKGVIGEFALEKINDLIKQLNKSKQAIDHRENKTDLLQNINLIGEPFLRNKLLDMYYSMFDKEKRIEELEAELKKLKEND
ncbi:hypothetical protein [Chryseobacterium oryctis]|uniref:AAA ATPase domain-containing protein n=1 Tax=Chryseobacterium oryctis TaxID=2952618 RepID=A0ABT3HNJ8_9FLAO|nr:hypothetical protein [Chryseobacterium oryctis]MCW3161329.1 hypothetical protein [Chryseobacterium oryctis]